ncbi:MAG: ddpX [Parcubacteria group bacterium]|nr:ddpX [Parcubacteria group bacterium]
MMEQIPGMTPDEERDKIVVKENNEPLVEIKETDRIKLRLLKPIQAAGFVRKTLWEKLMRVSESLPENMVLLPIEGYRSMDSQREGWEKWCKAIQTEHPEWSEVQVEKEAVRIVARPHPLANHHCGGAIDITIGYMDGSLVDMGTPYPDGTEGDAEREKLMMFSENITAMQTANRKILRDAMAAQDIAYYPAEWWHYCWGDRMWAVHTRRTECLYGPAELLVA